MLLSAEFQQVAPVPESNNEQNINRGDLRTSSNMIQEVKPQSLITNSPQTLPELIQLLRGELNERGIQNNNIERIKCIMRDFKCPPEDWEQYAFWDSKKYTRNLVDRGNDNYNLILLCWGPKQLSPVHDHPGSHCIMKMLQGSLTETRFEPPKSTNFLQKLFARKRFNCGLVKTGETRLNVNDTAHIQGEGIHKVANDTQEGAVSIHIYSPPILECSTFCKDTGKSRGSGKCVFFSKFGRRVA